MFVLAPLHLQIAWHVAWPREQWGLVSEQASRAHFSHGVPQNPVFVPTPDRPVLLSDSKQ